MQTSSRSLPSDMGDEGMRMRQLTKEERERYSRQMLLEGVGEAGQQKLLASKVLIVGAGGLGSPAAMYLAASGIGEIGIVNLHSQKGNTVCPKHNRDAAA